VIEFVWVVDQWKVVVLGRFDLVDHGRFHVWRLWNLLRNVSLFAVVHETEHTTWQD
jgi:hypothetical protein